MKRRPTRPALDGAVDDVPDVCVERLERARRAGASAAAARARAVQLEEWADEHVRNVTRATESAKLAAGRTAELYACLADTHSRLALLRATLDGADLPDARMETRPAELLG